MLGLAGADFIFQWIGLVEYIPSYFAPELHRGLLPASRLANKKILIEQNIKKRTGPALCVLCGLHWEENQTGFKLAEVFKTDIVCPDRRKSTEKSKARSSSMDDFRVVIPSETKGD
jgi:hypothetical protein